jgi:hypothetical protein
MVVERFANGCNTLRLEALALINENPVTVRDLCLLRLIL